MCKVLYFSNDLKHVIYIVDKFFAEWEEKQELNISIMESQTGMKKAQQATMLWKIVNHLGLVLFTLFL